MAIFSHQPAAPGGFVYPYKIDQSCRFNSGDNAYLHKTWGGAPTDGDKLTFSTWFKRGKDSTGSHRPLIGGEVDANHSEFLVFQTNTLSGITYFLYSILPKVRQ
jgi:hypothetical protein